MDFKIDYSCPQCHESISLAQGYLENDETVALVCKNGHETQAFMVVPRFSLYFDKGVQALKQGYYLEGYSWTYTSLEVFRKDFVKAYMSVINNIPIKIIDKTFDGRFKSSENIYGAYAFAFLSYFGYCPDVKEAPFPIISGKEINRRNSMYHSGKMLTKDEIMEDCYSIYLHMLYGYQNFLDNDNFAIMDYYARRYSYWAGEKAISDEKMQERKIVLLNSDLGVFSSNLSFNIGKGELDNYPTLDDLLKKAGPWIK
ncbi:MULTISPECIES: hypothetical protein [Bacteria]|uniref:hypothetical protein n=1 Tax=Bacteria TaxID=2 RepID=UPI00115DDE24|nr:hypothetical protein [Enterococcus casseliflavus]